MKFIYPAVIHPLKEGGFEATFPDLEDCRAKGFSIDDVMEEANAAALAWITLELEEELPLPPVSDPQDIPLAEGDFVRNVCVTYRAYDGWDE